MFLLLAEPLDILDRWLNLVRQHGIVGRQVHDARLVALAIAHGIEHILTINTSDYTRYSMITAVHPSAI